MAYVALYRKYRSQSFDELMGQQHVTQTLQNAIKSGRIAHAYLFHGARGCGKTSTARLLARALNCESGPTPAPCGVCRLCVAIRDGHCLDVIEMDAASETGIDDVREKIIEGVQYAPAEARYKVFIIDEVHDLSSKAFDALLKTLEEPPAHVIFILATTEKHKVPITIRSRCQDYPFKRGTLSDLGTAIQRVITAENYTAEPEAVLGIARAAEGSWRDALSLLEQVMAYSDGHLTAETVHRAIGSVGSETLARVVEVLALNRWDATYAIAAELIESGTDARQLLTSLQAYLRDLMLISAGATQMAKQEFGEDRFAQMQPQAALFDPPTLLAMQSLLSAADRELRFSNQHRIILENTLLRMMPCEIERQAAAPPQNAAGKPATETRSAPARSSRETPPFAPPPLAATPSVVPRPTSPHLVDYTDAPPAPLLPEPAPKEAASAAPNLKIVAAQQPEVDKESAVSSDISEARFATVVTLEVMQRAWPRILQMVDKVSKPAVNFLSKAEPVALDGHLVTLRFTDSFARERIQEKARELVEKAINKALATEGFKIRCEMADKIDAPASDAPSAPAQPLALLDAPPPIAPPTGTSRIMDIEMPVATPAHVGRGSAKEPDRIAETPAPASPPEKSFLSETLELFEGEVVHSEPLNPG
jgi:DNA polymerase-3 subunit gamma/tau